VDSVTETIPSVPADSSFTNAAKMLLMGCHPKHNTIIVECKPMTVPRNLYNFLQIVYQKYPDEPFWIDALCIKQDSTVERNHQVSRMGEMCSNAKQVLAWIGPCDSGVNSLDVLPSKILVSEHCNEVEKMLVSQGDRREKSLPYSYSRFS
jgi:hypothetical protein